MRTVIAIALAVGCLGLAACDGDEEETTSASSTESTGSAEGTPETPIEADDDGDPSSGTLEVGAPSPTQTIELVLTSSNPEDACVPPHVTEAYVSAAYGSASGCSQALAEGGPIADSVEVGTVNESGDSAAAVAVAVGGVYDGEEIEVELVRQGANWSVDSVLVDVPAGP